MSNQEVSCSEFPPSTDFGLATVNLESKKDIWILDKIKIYGEKEKKQKKVKN